MASANTITASGNCRIDSLEVGAGAQAVREKRVECTYDLAVNTREQGITLKQVQLASQLLSAKMAGTIDRYSTACVLSLSGSYEGSWESITSLIHELAPATRDVSPAAWLFRAP